MPVHFSSRSNLVDYAAHFVDSCFKHHELVLLPLLQAHSIPFLSPRITLAPPCDLQRLFCRVSVHTLHDATSSPCCSRYASASSVCQYVFINKVPSVL